MEGRDYWGEPVFAFVGSVPDSSWFIVAKIDREEIYAPLRELSMLIIAITVALTVSSGLGVGMFWRGRRVSREAVWDSPLRARSCPATEGESGWRTGLKTT